jgi:hypothetical protein
MAVSEVGMWDIDWQDVSCWSTFPSFAKYEVARVNGFKDGRTNGVSG